MLKAIILQNIILYFHIPALRFFFLLVHGDPTPSPPKSELFKILSVSALSQVPI